MTSFTPYYKAWAPDIPMAYLHKCSYAKVMCDFSSSLLLFFLWVWLAARGMGYHLSIRLVPGKKHWHNSYGLWDRSFFCLAFAYLNHFFSVGQGQTSQADGKMWTQGRVVKCAAAIPSCVRTWSDKLHTLSSPVCNFSLDSAYFPPEGRGGEPVNEHSSLGQKIFKKIRALTW